MERELTTERFIELCDVLEFIGYNINDEIYITGKVRIIHLNLDLLGSWGLLMKAVIKLETMDYGFKMCRKVVEFYVDSTKEVLIHVKEGNRYDSLVKGVIEAVKHHNKINNL